MIKGIGYTNSTTDLFFHDVSGLGDTRDLSSSAHLVFLLGRVKLGENYGKRNPVRQRWCACGLGAIFI